MRYKIFFNNRNVSEYVALQCFIFNFANFECKS